MAYEQGFYLKIKGYVDSLKAGKTTLDQFADQLERAYAFKQKGKPEIEQILSDPEYLEHIEGAIEQAHDGLQHMEDGFTLLFDYIESQDPSLLQEGLDELKICTNLFNHARDLALDESEDATLNWRI